MNKGDRTVAGFELSDHYCEIIIRRWESIGGITPAKVGNILEGEPQPQIDASNIPESLGF